MWRRRVAEFEERVQSNLELQRFLNKMFFVWDGNHRLKTWYPLINEMHSTEAEFHVPMMCTLVMVTRENKLKLVNAMWDINK